MLEGRKITLKMLELCLQVLLYCLSSKVLNKVRINKLRQQICLKWSNILFHIKNIYLFIMHGYQQQLDHPQNPLLQFEGAARIQSPPSKMMLNGATDENYEDSQRTMRSKILLYQRQTHNNQAQGTTFNHQESSGLSSAISGTALGMNNNRMNSNYFQGKPGDMRNQRFQQNTTSSNNEILTPLWSRKQHQDVNISQAATSAHTQNYYNGQRKSADAYASSSIFGQSQIQSKPVTANINQRRRVIATANGLQSRPFTMGGINHLASHSVSISDNVTDSHQDPRKAIKDKKQRLQQGFYETLRQGQALPEGTNSEQNLAKRITTSTMALNGNQQMRLSQNQLPKQSLVGLGSGQALCFKTETQKYLLMREILQKKSLEEIIQLKQQLQKTQRLNKEIHMPQMKGGNKLTSITQTSFNKPTTNVQTHNIVSPHTHSMSSKSARNSNSDEEEEEDDAEPFEHSQNTRIPDNGSPKRPETTLTQDPVQLQPTQQISEGLGDSSVQGQGKFNVNIVRAQMKNRGGSNKSGLLVKHGSRDNSDLPEGVQTSKPMTQGKSKRSYKTTRQQQPNSLSLIAAHRHEEKRLSQPYKQDGNQHVNDSMISRYHYCGVPAEYKADTRSVNVRLRKRRLEEQQAFESYCGCKKFSLRQHHSHTLQQQQLKENPAETALLDSPRIAPYADEDELIHKNNQLKQQVYLESQFVQVGNYPSNFGNSENVMVTSQILASKNKQDMMMEKKYGVTASQLSSGLGVEDILAKDKLDKYQKELLRAKHAVETIKRLRIDEGPEDPTVYAISQKVHAIAMERDKILAQTSSSAKDLQFANRAPLNEKIRLQIKEESANVKEAYEALGYLEAVFKVHPAIRPVGGALPIQVDQDVFQKSKRNVASLSDLVISPKSKNTTQQFSEIRSGQFEHTQNIAPSHFAGQQQQQPPEYDQPFTRWGTINTSLQQILNTQKFGDVYSVTQKEETIIKDYLFRRYPVLKEHQVQFKIGKVPDTQFSLPTLNQVPASQFNIVFYGPRCPLSKCCKLSLCLCLCGLTASAKINCMGAGGGAILSHYNPQQQYPLELEMLRMLFPGRYPRIMGESDIPKLKIDNTAGHAQAVLDSQRSSHREAQAIDNSINRAVVAGTHKFQSLRAVAVASRETLKRRNKQSRQRKRRARQERGETEVLSNENMDGMDDDEMDEMLSNEMQGGIDQIFGDEDDEDAIDIDMDDMMGSENGFKTIKENALGEEAAGLESI